MPLDRNSTDCVYRGHAAQQLGVIGVVADASRELRRVLEPDGMLRICSPDPDEATAAYQNGRRDYFWC